MTQLIGERYTIQCEIADRKMEVLWDTGSQVSLISAEKLKEIDEDVKVHALSSLLEAKVTLEGVSGNSIPYIGYVNLKLKLDREKEILAPFLVTKDEIADVNNLKMSLDVNGTRMQTGNTSTMIFNVDIIVSYLSKFMSLQAGDIITTGTPPGVGMGKKPQIFLKNGDKLRLSMTKFNSNGVYNLHFREAIIYVIPSNNRTNDEGGGSGSS